MKNNLFKDAKSTVYLLLIYHGIYVIASLRTGLLARYPWEDLYWNDFQIYNTWIWFSDAIRTGGLPHSLSSIVDFRQNTGELIASSSKIYNPALDIAAWIYVLTENVDIAFFSKFYIYSSLCALSYYKLLETNSNYQKTTKNTKIFIWAILVASTIFHPVFHYETGPLNQWYLLLTPAWILVIKEIVDRNAYLDAKNLLKVLALTLISLGSSDLFFISSITVIYLTFIIINFKKVIIYRLLKVYGFIIIVTLIDKSYFIKETILKDSTISSQGSWSGRYYWDSFLYPLIKYTFEPIFVGPANLYINIFILGLIAFMLINPYASDFKKNIQTLIIVFLLLIGLGFSLLKPSFVGPVNMYFNFLILGLIAFMLINSSASDFKKNIQTLIIVFILFIGLGYLSHQFLSQLLPSAIRYHLNLFPFLLMSIIAAYGLLDNRYVSRTLKFSQPLNILVLTTLIFVLSYNRSVSEDLTNRQTLFEYRNVVNIDVRNYYMSTLPNCINSKIVRENKSLFSKSYLFVKKEGTSSSMDDTLLILSEQPNNLYGRTFNQWRYTTNQLNFNLHQHSESSGLFSRPFLAENIIQIRKFSNLTLSPFLISTESNLSNNFRLLGICFFPESLRSYVSANPTLAQNVYIFVNDEVVSGNQAGLENLNYLSSNLILIYRCQPFISNFLTIPTNYLSELNVTVNGITADPSLISHGPFNSTALKLDPHCINQDNLEITLSTKSQHNFIKNILILSLPGVLLLLIFFQNKRKNLLTDSSERVTGIEPA